MTINTGELSCGFVMEEQNVLVVDVNHLVSCVTYSYVDSDGNNHFETIHLNSSEPVNEADLVNLDLQSPEVSEGT